MTHGAFALFSPLPAWPGLDMSHVGGGPTRSTAITFTDSDLTGAVLPACPCVYLKCVLVGTVVTSAEVGDT